jgi:hypothetical protein
VKTKFWRKPLKCKCGAAVSVHGYCQKHWESDGKAKYLRKFEEEAKAMVDDRRRSLYYSLLLLFIRPIGYKYVATRRITF